MKILKNFNGNHDKQGKFASAVKGAATSATKATAGFLSGPALGAVGGAVGKVLGSATHRGTLGDILKKKPPKNGLSPYREPTLSGDALLAERSAAGKGALKGFRIGSAIGEAMAGDNIEEKIARGLGAYVSAPDAASVAVVGSHIVGAKNPHLGHLAGAMVITKVGAHVAGSIVGGVGKAVRGEDTEKSNRDTGSLIGTGLGLASMAKIGASISQKIPRNIPLSLPKTLGAAALVVGVPTLVSYTSSRLAQKVLKRVGDASREVQNPKE
jgi:hypothetical protein